MSSTPGNTSGVDPLVSALATGTSIAMSEKEFAHLSPEQVRAYERDLMRRVADLALIPPMIKTEPVPEFDYDKLDYGMTIGIERTPRGRIWCAWVAGDDGPRAFFLAASSDDEGKTWSKPRIVIKGDAPTQPMSRSVIIGNFWTDPLGRLWFFFDQTMHHFDGRSGLWYIRCDNPDDASPRWSEPVRIWHGSMLNKPIVLSSGEWMLPTYLLQNGGFGPFNGVFPELDPFRGVNILISTDQGQTWQRRGHVAMPNPCWHEPMIVERRDGSLWMLVRTKHDIAETISHDRGRTWSTPIFPASIQQPGARFFLRRLSSGRVLLIKHGDRIDDKIRVGNHRVKLSAWLSEDEGQTWTGGLILDERDGVSYPDGFQAPDGSIFISYDRNRAAEGKIFLARFTENDILAQQLVSPGSELGRCIIQPLGLKPKH